MTRSDATILVVSSESDWTACTVADELSARGASYEWWDPSRFPARAGATARIGPTNLVATDSVENAGGWSGAVDGLRAGFRWERITAVLYRRPADFTVDQGMSGPERRFARGQARVGLGGVLASLPVRWLNHPSVLADSEYKPRQLALAERVGLRVPPTLITNVADEVRTFARECGGDVVTKPLTRPMLAEAGGQSIAWTRRVAATEIDELPGVELTAHLFQQWVPKDHEVRLIAVGDRRFAVAIHAGSEAAYIDWRSDYEALTYRQVPIPSDIDAAVTRYLARFGLRYAAFDFVVDPRGRWVFLEANGSGQWGWLAEECGLPIVAAFADDLAGPVRASHG